MEYTEKFSRINTRDEERVALENGAARLGRRLCSAVGGKGSSGYSLL
jgi:hypothetical protein